MTDKIGYARVSTADQNPQLQLDALAAEDCLKVYTDRASGKKVDRPQWTACLADLRPGDTLIIWRIDRLGRNLRYLIDIVTILQAHGVGVRSLSNGLVPPNSVPVTEGSTSETATPSSASSLRATADSMFTADLDAA